MMMRVVGCLVLTLAVGCTAFAARTDRYSVTNLASGAELLVQVVCIRRPT
jgi:hypothetical protein